MCNEFFIRQDGFTAIFSMNLIFCIKREAAKQAALDQQKEEAAATSSATPKEYTETRIQV